VPYWSRLANRADDWQKEIAPQRWIGYALAVAFTALASLMRWALPEVLTGTPYLAFYPAVVAAAGLFGMGPGVAATVASLLCVHLLFGTTSGDIGLDPLVLTRQAIFLAGGVGISVVAGMQKASQARQRNQADELAQNERRFRSFVEATTQVVWTTNPRGEVDMAIPSWQAYTGQTEEQARGFGWMDAIRAEDRPRVIEAWQRAFDTGGLYEVEYLVRIHDGSWRNVLARGVPVRDSDGTVRQYIGACIDITERKRAEDALLRAKQEWERTFDSVPDLIAILDTEHRIVRANRAMAGRLGVTPEQSVGLTCFSCVHGAPLPPETCPHRQTLQDGQEHSAELCEARLGGDFLVSTTPLLDEQGRMVGAVHVARDITERRRAEAERDRQHQLFRRLVETSKEVVGEKSLSGLLQKVADAARELTGARVASSGHGYVQGTFLVGAASRDEDFPPCPPGQDFAVEKGGVYMELIESVDSLRLTDAEMRDHPAWRGLPLDHAPMRGLLGVRLVDAQGKANGTIMVSDKRDGEFTEQDEAILRQLGAITSLALQHVQARDQAEAAKNSAERAKTAAEQANRAKDHFLAVLSHELRTPLTPVVMGVAMLQDKGDLDPAARETLEMIRRNVEMEARLIDDLLDVTRISRGKIELQKQRVELRTVIQRAVEVCKPDIEARRLRFGVDLGPDAPYWIEADVARLQQVFWNLLKNAIKFTPHGGCVGFRCRPEGRVQGSEVSASLNPESRTLSPCVVVEVNDSGIGMEPEALSRIFNAFEQAERSITRQFGGLGLGLAISKALVEMHGGKIEAHSEGKGKGATFRVRLPLTVPAGEPTPPAAAAPPQRVVRPLRILLVEDHGVTAKMMRMVLSEEGHTVEMAADVATGLEIASQHDFDLLISDLGLPDASGYDLMRQLRLRGQRLPGIAMSGYGQEEDIQRSYVVGFSAHLTKPASRERLIEAIAAVTAQ